MRMEDASRYISQMQVDPDPFGPGIRPWADRTHVATTRLAEGVAMYLTRGVRTLGDSKVALVELHLVDELPYSDYFGFISDVDDVGIWWIIGQEESAPDVQCLIPWRSVKAIVVHGLETDEPGLSEEEAL